MLSKINSLLNLSQWTENKFSIRKRMLDLDDDDDDDDGVPRHVPKRLHWQPADEALAVKGGDAPQHYSAFREKFKHFFSLMSRPLSWPETKEDASPAKMNEPTSSRKFGSLPATHVDFQEDSVLPRDPFRKVASALDPQFRFSPSRMPGKDPKSSSFLKPLGDRGCLKRKVPLVGKNIPRRQSDTFTLSQRPCRPTLRLHLSTKDKKNKYMKSVLDCFRLEDKNKYHQLLHSQSHVGSSSLFSSSAVKLQSSGSQRFAGTEVQQQSGAVTQSCYDWLETEAKKKQIEVTCRPKLHSTPLSCNTSLKHSHWLPSPPSSQSRLTPKKSPIPEIDLTSPTLEDDGIEIIREILSPRLNSLDEKLREKNICNREWLEDMKKKYSTKEMSKNEALEKQRLFSQSLKEKKENIESELEITLQRRLSELDIKYHPIIHDIEEEEEEELEDLLPLTSQMEAVIDGALKRHPPGEVLSEKFSLQITRKDLATLAGLNWLNDEVINFYMNMLVDRGQQDNYPSVYAFNTFFYPRLVDNGYNSVRRWTKKVDVFSYEILLIPVHLGMHWCLAVVDFKKKEINYYDSMLGDNNRCLQALLSYLLAEHNDKKKAPYDGSDWTVANVKDIPQQMNGSDCGMFACKFAEYISRRARIAFSQEHMPYFRRRMVYEIVTKRLL